MAKLLVCLIAALSCVPGFAQAGQKNTTTVEQQIVALERAWAAAQKANDAASIASLLADDYIEVLPDGSLMNKAQVLADAKQSHYDTIEGSDIRVIRSGDTAIAVGTFDANHAGKDGKPLHDHERYVDTWRKMPDGKWLCIAEGNTALR